MDCLHNSINLHLKDYSPPRQQNWVYMIKKLIGEIGVHDNETMNESFVSRIQSFEFLVFQEHSITKIFATS